MGEYLEFARSAGLRAGIEMDWVSGSEDTIANVLDRHDLDYVVGSVHFIRDKAVDDDAYDVWEEINDPDKVWALYFETFAEAIQTGHVRHLRPPGPREGLGRRAAADRAATRAFTTSR